jgi:hypothetical protein
MDSASSSIHSSTGAGGPLADESNLNAASPSSPSQAPGNDRRIGAKPDRIPHRLFQDARQEVLVIVDAADRGQGMACVRSDLFACQLPQGSGTQRFQNRDGIASGEPCRILGLG